MQLLLLTADPGPGSVLPALSLLGHGVQLAAPKVAALLDARPYDAVLVDARSDLAGSRSLCWLLGSTGLDVPVVVVISQGGLVALSADWGFDEILLPTAGPAEVEARLRLLVARRATEPDTGRRGVLSLGELVIDEATYTVRLRGRPLDLTYKEFELLKYLAQHAGRVFTRAQLLQEVWGYDFFGGSRTVDVHVRRLRAKLGLEHEQLIGTVRNVGYKFVRPVRSMSSRERAAPERAADVNSTDTDRTDRKSPRGAYQQAIDSGHADVAPAAATYLQVLPK
jgi:DNA-binding response OmpR family regulator